MTRTIAIVFAALLTLATGQAYAQESGPGPGLVELSIVPAGATFFQSEGPAPSFGNYGLGGSLVVNLNRIVGFEAEANTTLGSANQLQFGDLGDEFDAPNTLTYTGNVVISAPARHGLVPYVTAGGGGLTMFERVNLGVAGAETFLTGNAGGGLKWYAPSSRWGLRADYRFIGVASRDEAPAFFGQENRFGHRVYAGVLINLVR